MDADYASSRAHAEKIQAEHQRWIANSIDRPVQWYRTLIDVSNHVFIIENTLRRFRDREARETSGV